ncbi:hypothetical protein HKCCE3408_13715 [Rhodobacterales bacterium HKCCE3408]|nr:hypothetical protein [Rhodobacterales bacterium HKCCE3408]
MKRFLTSTALVACLATPAALFAQENGDAQNNNNAATQIEEMGITASALIGHRLYMPSAQDGENADAEQSADGSMSTDAEGDDDMQTAEAEDGSGTDDAMQTADAETGDSETGDNGTRMQTAEADIPGEVNEVPSEWNMVGDINDVLISEDGEVRSLIVDAGGFLGMGETQRQVDLQNVRFVQDSDDEGEYFVVYTGNRSTFEEQTSYDQEAVESEGYTRASESEQYADMQDDMGEPENVGWDNVTTEELLGIAVYDSNDEWVGDLSELQLADSDQIENAIIDVGGFLGIGEKPVQMPIDQVELIRVNGNMLRAYISATEEELDEMPAWTPNES